MPIERLFLTWNEPFLPQLCDWLIGQAGRPFGDRLFDLSEMIVVLPVRAAKRRLEELLVDATEGRMLLPTVMTPADFPEQLYALQKPLATSHTQSIAWVRALQSIPREQLGEIVPNPPADSAHRDWLALAELLASQHRELAGDDLDFEQVADRLRTLLGRHEQSRWDALAAVERNYLDEQLLANDLWDRQKARLTAIDYKECRTDRHLVLAATSDLNMIVRKMVEQASSRKDEPARVTSLVHADASAADLFDEFGGLVASKWADACIDIPDEDVLSADDVTDQVETVGVMLAELGRFRTDEISIGCPNDSLAGPIRARLEDCGVDTSWIVGRELVRTPPAMLLRALASHLEQPTAESLVALVRLPSLRAVWPAGCSPASALAELDRFREERLPRRLQSKTLREAHDYHLERRPDRPGYENAIAVLETVEAIIEPFAAQKTRADGWGHAIQSLLRDVFADQSDEAVTSYLRAIDDAIGEVERLPVPFVVPQTAAEAIADILNQLRGRAIPSEGHPHAVAVTGWLEMPLDDRPVAIVTSFNEGVIPTSVTSDLFLPGSVRSALGLNDNARRFARDAYATTVLLKSRQVVKFIVGRRNADGEPLAPSRLLFRCEPIDTARRLRTLLHEKPNRPSLATSWTTNATAWLVPVPEPTASTHPRRSISVTAFSSYLACPYRFYLGHEKGLRTVESDLSELSGRAFGTLLHDALSQFGRSDVRDSTDADEITAFLDEHFGRRVATLFEREPQPAVRVQLQQARTRLHAFAKAQVAHRLTGWSIDFAEDEESDDRFSVPFALADGRSMTLTGRIDRIDRHDDLGYAIIDYKSSDANHSPVSSHLKRKQSEPFDRWTDLQLPLYRHLARERTRSDSPQLAYFNLPKQTSDSGIQWADFTSDELAEADEVARTICGRILDDEFPFDPNLRPRYDDFEAICQSSVLNVNALGREAS